VHDRINSNLDIQWRQASKRRRSPTERPELVNNQIEQADIKQIGYLAQEDEQGQTTFIQPSQQPPRYQPAAGEKTPQAAGAERPRLPALSAAAASGRRLHGRDLQAQNGPPG
jgi:hypothetical protein